ncbi:Holliday junction resolvase RuvX [Amphibiibacter pelophylacis]|uniref:Holliday junction resolvase RuvX n=1 Tax=Amphibiibacter pelophylacis TaxID=1799477 RepID=A0ACC6P450_9BURK
MTPVQNLPDPAPRSGPDQTLLALDYGTRHIGVAVGNTLMRRAQALKTLSVRGQEHWQALDALIAEWQPTALVVGLPFHPDGAEHINTARARRFARQLRGRCRLDIHLEDERYSTCEAAGAEAGSGSRASHSIDARAAAVILQQYLDRL